MFQACACQTSVFRRVVILETDIKCWIDKGIGSGVCSIIAAVEISLR